MFVNRREYKKLTTYAFLEEKFKFLCVFYSKFTYLVNAFAFSQVNICEKCGNY